MVDKLKMEKTKSENEKYDYLLARLGYFPSMRDDRDNLMILAVYGEYVIENLFQKRFPNSNKEVWQQQKRVKLLHDLGDLSDYQCEIFIALANVRNKFAHDLIISEETLKDVDNIMKKVKDVAHTSKEMTPEDIKERSKYPFFKFQSSCATVIGKFMEGFAKEKKQDFKPESTTSMKLNKDAHPYYAIAAYEVNVLIDQEKHKDFSIKEFRDIVETGNIIDYLEKKFKKEIDFSLISPKNRKDINDNLDAYVQGYYGQEMRKFGVGNYGLNLMQAYLINIMQNKISEYIYLRPRDPPVSPKVDK